MKYTVLFMLCSISILTHATHKPDAQQYGIALRINANLNEPALEKIEKQFIRTCQIAHVSCDNPQNTGLEVATGMPLCIVTGKNEATRIKNQLSTEGYESEIIEIIWAGKDIENPTVISFEQIAQINAALMEACNNDLGK